MYRYMTITQQLENKDRTGSTDYKAILTDHFVREHLYFAVDALIITKRRMAQKRSWHLPPCID